MEQTEVEKAIAAVSRLDQLIKTKRNKDYNKLVVKRISLEEIVGAEKELGCELPPSYKRFIQDFGVFHIESVHGHDYERLWEPKELAFGSNDTYGSGRPEEEEYIKKLIFFKNAPYEDNLAGFNTSRRREDGEMPVEIVYHDDENSPPEDFTTFLEMILSLVDEYESCDELK